MSDNPYREPMPGQQPAQPGYRPPMSGQQPPQPGQQPAQPGYRQPMPGQPPMQGQPPMPGQPPMQGQPMPGQMPPAGYRRVGNFLKPGRGGLILALSLLGGFSCGITPIIAVILGMIDLGEIKRGKIEPDARGMTLAGVIIGWISIGGFVLYLLFVVIMGSTGQFDSPSRYDY